MRTLLCTLYFVLFVPNEFSPMMLLRHLKCKFLHTTSLDTSIHPQQFVTFWLVDCATFHHWEPQLKMRFNIATNGTFPLTNSASHHLLLDEMLTNFTHLQHTKGDNLSLGLEDTGCKIESPILWSGRAFYQQNVMFQESHVYPKKFIIWLTRGPDMAVFHLLTFVSWLLTSQGTKTGK